MQNFNMTDVQNKALNFLREGKEKYNNAGSPAQRNEGYDLYIKGIELLIQLQRYMKDNPSVSNMLSQRIKEYMGEAKKMKESINNPSSFGGNANNNSRSGMNNKDSSNMSGGGGDGGNGGGGDGDRDEEAEGFKSALSEAIVIEKPNVTWDDVAGLKLAKQTLKEAIILPNKFPDIFVGIRKPWKGILLYGPPGTGKSFIAKACANMADATFFSISSSNLVSKWVGESEKLVKELFRLAKEKEPSIIFIDEIDSLVSARGEGEGEASRRVKTEFLVQMQGVGSKEGKILVLGATNFPWGLDPAMRRRFQKRIYIPLPDFEARYHLLKNNLDKHNSHTLTLDQMKELGQRLDGYSGSDIASFFKQAAMEPMRKTQEATHFRQNPDGTVVASHSGDPQARPMKLFDIDGTKLVPPPLVYEDFLRAFSKAKKSVGPEDLIKHQQFTRDYGMEAQGC